MRIAINTRLLIKGKLDGIGWFTAETARRLAREHPDHTFYFFFDRKPDSDFLFADNVKPVVLCPQARHPLLWWAFLELATSAALKKYHIDLYVSPDGMIPLHTDVPTLSVIHDLNFEHAPDNLRPSHQRYMKHFFPRFAQKATRLATVSEYSQVDIAATYGIDKAKIDVVYDGAHNDYHPVDENQKQAVRDRYTAGDHYIIFVSTILKRKNLANLLKAFDKVKEDFHDGLKLVVVGAQVWWKDELATAYNNMKHKESVLLTGRVESDELALLLSSADALVYPSFFEGFGIPILEAMYAETAVICSNTTSMPEVAGDAALYIDPYSPPDIARAITLVRNEPLRNELIAKGRSRRDMFSWDRTSNLLWNSMMNTLSKQ